MQSALPHPMQTSITDWNKTGHSGHPGWTTLGCQRKSSWSPRSYASIALAQTTKARSSGGLVPETEQERATCSNILASKTEQERVTSSVVLGHETSPSLLILRDQYHVPNFIVKVPTKKWTFPPKLTLFLK